MPTLEQINKGAYYYVSESIKAQAQADYHAALGSPWAGEWARKAVEYAQIALNLRKLAENE